MEMAFTGHADLEPAMQFACGIVNICLASSYNGAAFDRHLRKLVSLGRAKRPHISAI